MLIKLVFISLLMIAANIVFIKFRWASCSPLEQMVYTERKDYPVSMIIASLATLIWVIVAFISTIVLVITW